MLRKSQGIASSSEANTGPMTKHIKALTLLLSQRSCCPNAPVRLGHLRTARPPFHRLRHSCAIRGPATHATRWHTHGSGALKGAGDACDMSAHAWDRPTQDGRRRMRHAGTRMGAAHSRGPATQATRWHTHGSGALKGAGDACDTRATFGRTCPRAAALCLPPPRLPAPPRLPRLRPAAEGGDKVVARQNQSHSPSLPAPATQTARKHAGIPPPGACDPDGIPPPGACDPDGTQTCRHPPSRRLRPRRHANMQAFPLPAPHPGPDSYRADSALPHPSSHTHTHPSPSPLCSAPLCRPHLRPEVVVPGCVVAPAAVIAVAPGGPPPLLRRLALLRLPPPCSRDLTDSVVLAAHVLVFARARAAEARRLLRREAWQGGDA
eukprot:353472-Chlamydomonas_euryale.AAC.9